MSVVDLLVKVSTILKWKEFLEIVQEYYLIILVNYVHMHVVEVVVVYVSVCVPSFWLLHCVVCTFLYDVICIYVWEYSHTTLVKWEFIRVELHFLERGRRCRRVIAEHFQWEHVLIGGLMA